MDENYLDNLLNEFSLDKEIDNKIEDELDNQIAKEKREYQKSKEKTPEDLFNYDLEQDSEMGVLDQDLEFSEEQMDELDNLDQLADLDIGDLDFSDIDLNDLDLTRLDDMDASDIEALIKDFEGDFEINDNFDVSDGTAKDGALQEGFETSLSPEDSSIPQQDDLNEDTFDADEFLDSLLDETEEAREEQIPEWQEDLPGQSIGDVTPDGSMDGEAVADLDVLMTELEDQEPGYDAVGAMDGFSDFGKVEENTDMNGEPSSDLSGEDTVSENDESALDDLFSLLDLDEDEEGNAMAGGMEDSTSFRDTSMDNPEDVDNSLTPEETVSETGTKKGKLMQILFGDPDEDDELSEEEIAAAEAKKAEKKAKKQAAKEAKKEKAEIAKQEKEIKAGQKKKENEEKQRVRAEKRAKRRAEELANAEPEKNLNKPAVIFIFSVLLGGTALLYLASNNFNYAMVIEKATNYFESQKYHKAYDEIKGVEVKEKDQDLKDRIYTVIYVERLYESYENNVKLGFDDKALDALLRGVDKYYQHYDEAVELGIVNDIDYSFAKIQQVLENQYGISVDKALEINHLDDDDYVLTIRSYVENNKSNAKPEGEAPDTSQEPENGINAQEALPPEDGDTLGQHKEEVTQE